MRLNISTFCSEFVEILAKDFQFPGFGVEPISEFCYERSARSGPAATRKMIEGTKEYKRRSSAPPAVDEKSVPASGGGDEGTKIPAAPEAAQRAETLDRRAWFSALVPAFGDGLVKILRASNNLKDDLGLPR